MFLRGMLMMLAIMLLVSVGCGSSNTNPTQPKMTDAQIKEVMEKGKKDALNERGDKRG
jgi:hypothetical protein